MPGCGIEERLCKILGQFALETEHGAIEKRKDMGGNDGLVVEIQHHQRRGRKRAEYAGSQRPDTVKTAEKFLQGDRKPVPSIPQGSDRRMAEYHVPFAGGQ